MLISYADDMTLLGFLTKSDPAGDAGHFAHITTFETWCHTSFG